MIRLLGTVLGASATGALLWSVLAAFDPMALVDAQVVVLFVPVALAGAMAGYALASVFSRDEHDRAAAPGVLVRGGVVTLLIVLNHDVINHKFRLSEFISVTRRL